MRAADMNSSVRLYFGFALLIMAFYTSDKDLGKKGVRCATLFSTSCANQGRFMHSWRAHSSWLFHCWKKYSHEVASGVARRLKSGVLSFKRMFQHAPCLSPACYVSAGWLKRLFHALWVCTRCFLLYFLRTKTFILWVTCLPEKLNYTLQDAKDAWRRFCIVESIS